MYRENDTLKHTEMLIHSPHVLDDDDDDGGDHQSLHYILATTDGTSASTSISPSDPSFAV